jgi:hypothetical protein
MKHVEYSATKTSNKHVMSLNPNTTWELIVSKPVKETPRLLWNPKFH